ncbi:PC-esterase domain-containing protein 1A [Lampris incognitus]|uniref:PC-esterase domain-containing protein 1A n=1 Tax=Lampris incognitus TaxID=2546036 RepID=UPI0024B5DBAD|nr:PC-esterase domain-containing protein 1A [Lampris incognitus]
MKYATREVATKLLHNKFVAVLGDSIQRSVYKDIVLLLQKESYLTRSQLKAKGEMTFEQDCLVEGGCLGQMSNGIQYQEVRQFRSNHHLVRFYFLTKIYSEYMQSILDDFRHGLKPDVVIVNSCVWDISRYDSNWLKCYRQNLHKFFEELGEILPRETLVIWNLAMPLGKKIIGGFLVPEIEYKASQLRYDVVEANFFSGTLADAYGMDVVDLHFHFRLSLQHRVKDGVHWNAVAHRTITSLLLQHIAEAWGVILPCQPSAVEFHSSQRNYSRYVAFHENSIPMRPLYTNRDCSMEPNGQWQHRQWRARAVRRPSYPQWEFPAVRQPSYPPQTFGEMPGGRPCVTPSPAPAWGQRHQYIKRSYHHRSHYVPYSYRRPT